MQSAYDRNEDSKHTGKKTKRSVKHFKVCEPELLMMEQPIDTSRYEVSSRTQLLVRVRAGVRIRSNECFSCQTPCRATTPCGSEPRLGSEKNLHSWGIVL
jgi:hypothetical protein